MNLIIVTINDSNDWNHHKNLINDLDDYEFKTIFNIEVYDKKNINPEILIKELY